VCSRRSEIRALVEKKTGLEGNRTLIHSGFLAWCNEGSTFEQDISAGKLLVRPLKNNARSSGVTGVAELSLGFRRIQDGDRQTMRKSASLGAGRAERSNNTEFANSVTPELLPFTVSRTGIVCGPQAGRIFSALSSSDHGSGGLPLSRRVALPRHGPAVHVKSPNEWLQLAR
jgi:hypothetical protein